MVGSIVLESKDSFKLRVLLCTGTFQHDSFHNRELCKGAGVASILYYWIIFFIDLSVLFNQLTLSS